MRSMMVVGENFQVSIYNYQTIFKYQFSNIWCNYSQVVWYIEPWKLKIIWKLIIVNCKFSANYPSTQPRSTRLRSGLFLLRKFLVRSAHFGISLAEIKRTPHPFAGRGAQWLNHGHTLPLQFLSWGCRLFFVFVCGLNGIVSQRLINREPKRTNVCFKMISLLHLKEGRYWSSNFADGQSAVGRGRGERIGGNARNGHPAPAPLPLS